MKNRYLLLTLIFGFVGQMAQAISGDQATKLYINMKCFLKTTAIVRNSRSNLIANGNPQVIDNELAAQNLSSYDQLHIIKDYWAKLQLLIIHSNLRIDELEKTIEEDAYPRLTNLIKKYHPGLNFKLQLSGHNWATGSDLYGTPIIRVSHSYITSILNKRKSEEKYLALHEVARILHHKKNRNLTELEVDENIPNNPKILKAMAIFFTNKTSNREHHSPSNSSSHKNPTALVERKIAELKKRATRFEERYNKLTNQKARQFFGTPPTITGTSPRKAAKILGLDQDYYPNLSTDMLLKPTTDYVFQPTNLARYSFSRDKEFLNPRIVSAIE